MIKDGGQEGELQQFLALRENAMWLDRKDSNGETALMVATKHDRLREMDILFDHGANPNTANPQGETALHIAVSSGRVDTVRKLLERGAAVNILGPQGTPREVAVKHNAQDIVNVLDAKGNVGVGAKPLPGLPARGMKPVVKPRAPTAAPTTNSPPAAQPTRPSAGTTIARPRPVPPVPNTRPLGASPAPRPGLPRPPVAPNCNPSAGPVSPRQRGVSPIAPPKPSLIQPFGASAVSPSSPSFTTHSHYQQQAAPPSSSTTSSTSHSSSYSASMASTPSTSTSTSPSSLSTSDERPLSPGSEGRLRSATAADARPVSSSLLRRPPPPRPARRESNADVPPINLFNRPVSLTSAPMPAIPTLNTAAGAGSSTTYPSWQSTSPRGERGQVSPRVTMPPGAISAVGGGGSALGPSSASAAELAPLQATPAVRAATVSASGPTSPRATIALLDRKRAPRHTVATADDLVISSPAPASGSQISGPGLAGSRIGDTPFSPGQQKKEDPLMMRRRAAEEILTTEVAYVEQLSMLINAYKKPIDAAKVIDRMSLKGIFVNVEVLESLHRTFLSDLQQQMEQWSPENESPGLSSVILSLVPYLKLYIEYITDFDRSLKLVESLHNENEPYHQLIQTLGAGGFVGRLGLDSLRVVPIQRIPRYVLLLKALIKYTPEDHPDYKNLEEALHKMSELATFINTKKSEAESRNRLIELSANLVGKRLEGLEDVEEEAVGGKEPKEHKWRKKYNKYKQCDVCREMGYCTKCKVKECKFYLGIGGVHADCQQNVPHNCGQRRTEKTFIKHSRHLIKEEKELQHKMTSLKHPDSKAPLHKDPIVLLLNDGLAVLYPTEIAKYEFLALIKWVGPSGKPILNENVTETAFSLTDPRYNELHTFVAATKEYKEQFLNEMKQQMSNWHVAQSREREKGGGATSMDQFRGVTFQILFTVPVASTKEKEFTAYVVDMKTQKGTITIMKRYRQFLDLHHRLQNHYKASVIPKFPKKRYLGNNTSHKFIQKRCQKIGQYLNEMMQLPGILDIEEVKTFLTTSLSAKGEEELVGKQDESDQEKAQFIESIAPKEKKEESAGVAGLGQVTRAQTSLSIILKASPISGPGGLSPRGGGVEAKSPRAGATAKSPRGATGGVSPRPGLTKSESEATTPAAAANSERESESGSESTATATTPMTTTEVAVVAERLAKAVALYEFVPQSPKELALKADDVIVVHDREGDAWWFGTVDGTTFGYFPNNYVRLLPEAEW